MKLNKILLAGVMSLGVVSGANANSGTLKFEGQVVATPCSIDSDDVNQDIPLGTIALDSLKPGQTSPGKDFEIKLKGCDTSQYSVADIAFYGDAGHGKTFGVTGAAQNIGIQISGNGIIGPGESDVRPLIDGDVPLTYTAAVAADPDASKAVTAGNFTSTANFLITYR